ncbi:MAG: hypothetical protein Q4P24_09615 [Rhodobacterales bacterium]|nr:hypothetical protein [Rhodobacterales bacterium]
MSQDGLIASCANSTVRQHFEGEMFLDSPQKLPIRFIEEIQNCKVEVFDAFAARAFALSYAQMLVTA